MVEFKDLTLREGSQVPDLRISDEQGRRVIESLARLDVSCVELSFPRAQERAGWYRHADDLGLRTAALARATPGDVDAALAVDPDEVEIIITSSDVQLEHALGKSRDEARALLVENVRRVTGAGTTAGATLMDAMRADVDFLVECARAAVDAGAAHVTLADTTGAGTTDRVHTVVAAVGDAIGDDAAVAIHTHDDMGVATANATTGVTAGATRVDATIGGIGERAGNAPLEEVAVYLTERGDDLHLDVDELVPAAQSVHQTLDVDVSPDKPVIGDRAYKHESGLHTAAMLREPWTYMPFDPSTYGASNQLLFGEETGRGAVRALLESLDVDATDESVAVALEEIHDRAARADGPLSLEETRELLTDRFGTDA
ncbi:LeuA family protein [Halobaculum roseum]|uniref:2-isopropylmalate synthase n=1 Tax=Halobaculum roseum TaxID=2175149 RepID=A0ABD5MHR5_9EURY|nr:LeuA family protein [Halobaculum roseum]QZY01917.1 LeuA family protein [Halobaculum roseum]